MHIRAVSLLLLAAITGAGSAVLVGQTQSSGGVNLPGQIRALQADVAALRAAVSGLQAGLAELKVSTPLLSVLKLDEKGALSLVRGDKVLVKWQLAKTDGGGLGTFFNPAGSPVVSIGESSNGSGASWFYDDKTQLIAFLGANTAGNGRLELSAGGKKSIEMFAADEGGQLIVNGRKVRDFAEEFPIAGLGPVPPGTVVAVVAVGDRVAPSTAAYDQNVIGVVSGAGSLSPGIELGAADPASGVLVAMAGQVNVRVCDEGGVIRPGDLLVASNTAGVAMRAAEHHRALGAVIGKALESSNTRAGLLRMLVMSR